jgi:hypothetical protein
MTHLVVGSGLANFAEVASIPIDTDGELSSIAAAEVLAAITLIEGNNLCCVLGA